MTRKIFISYRREDTQPVAGRVYERLQRHYGPQTLFFDIENIPLGADFADVIAQAINQTSVLIVLVGERWTAKSQDGTRRLEDPMDFARIEIELALQRGIPIIPVLIDRARMPDVSELPSTIVEFSHRNAIQLDTGIDFDVHLNRLIIGIEPFLGSVDQRQAPRSEDALSAADDGDISYFCYISRTKVDQLYETLASEDVTSTLGKYCGGEGGTALSSTWNVDEIISVFERGITYGQSYAIQRERKINLTYVNKLKAVLVAIAQHQPILLLQKSLETNALRSLYYHHVGRFAVERPLNESSLDPIITLRAPLNRRALLLDCSLRFFSEGNQPDGTFHIHSANARFFAKEMDLTLETVFMLLNQQGGNLIGTPLFLKFSPLSEEQFVSL